MSTDAQELIEEDEPDGDDDSVPLCAVTTTDPVAMLDTLLHVLQLAKDAAQRPKEKYHTVLVPDGVAASLVTVDTFDEFLALWRTAYPQGGQIFGFHKGDVILPSEGGFMVAPWGIYSLYTKPSDTTGNPKGYLGPLPAISKATPAPVAADTVNGDIDDDEELPESDDDVVDEEEEEEEDN